MHIISYAIIFYSVLITQQPIPDYFSFKPMIFWFYCGLVSLEIDKESMALKAKLSGMAGKSSHDVWHMEAMKPKYMCGEMWTDRKGWTKMVIWPWISHNVQGCISVQYCWLPYDPSERLMRKINSKNICLHHLDISHAIRKKWCKTQNIRNIKHT